jgi:hypothetical protein
MRTHRAAIALLAVLASAALVCPVAADPWQPVQSRGSYRPVQNRAQYDRGYRDGSREGEQDARLGRSADIARDPRFRRGSDDFQNGYLDGYREAYERFRASVRSLPRRGGPGPLGYRRAPGNRGSYQDPAFARGYSDGFERGLDDGRDNDRYDPVRHRDYRNGDEGYFGGYGPRDAYKNNYRAGFRQGYEDGYRDGGRRGGRRF